MHVAAVLRRKGDRVISIGPDETVAAAARLLATHRIGALLVLGDGGSVRGILSERDIVRDLADYGEVCLSRRVADLMTREVLHCEPTDTIAEIMTVMTEHRIRHLPVMEDGRLVGVISIGDVVKQRLEEQAAEMESLRDYVAGRL